MLSERRVIHMTRMEICRQRYEQTITPYLNISRKDYLAGRNLAGFLAGSFFYGIVAFSTIATAVWFFADGVTKTAVVTGLIVMAIGYIVFIFVYRTWYYRRCVAEYNAARRKINQMKRDWDRLAEIYQDEIDAAKPSVDMDLLFPEGSLGET